MPKKLGTQKFKLYSGLTVITNILAASEFPLVLNTYLHNVEDVKRKSALFAGAAMAGVSKSHAAADTFRESAQGAMVSTAQ